MRGAPGPDNLQVCLIAVLDEEKVMILMNTAGFGIAAAALLVPLGAIDGPRIEGDSREIAFAAYLKDGQKFLATTDNRSWSAIRATLLPWPAPSLPCNKE